MRVFVAAILAAIAIAAAASVVLEDYQRSAEVAFTTSGVRL